MKPLNFWISLITLFSIFSIRKSFIINSKKPFSFRLIKSSELKSTIWEDETNFIDISPSKDRKVLKLTEKKGDILRGFPILNDTAIISFDVYDHTSNRFLFNSEKMSKGMGVMMVNFGYDEVIKGWEIALSTMNPSETAWLIIHPEFAFGNESKPPLFDSNMTLRTRLTLEQLVPYYLRSTDISNDSNDTDLVKEELMEKIANRQIDDSILNPLKSASEDIKDAEIVSNSSKVHSDRNQVSEKVHIKPKMFDPLKNTLDPLRRVYGEGEGHVWDEDVNNIEITIPIDELISKSDLQIEIQ